MHTSHQGRFNALTSLSKEAERDDEAFVEEAIAGDPRGFAHASARLRKDADFIMKMLRRALCNAM